MTAAVFALALAQASPAAAASPLPPRAIGHETLAAEFSVLPDLVYKTAGGVDLHLDVYKPRRAVTSTPTVVLFHGGGWVMGTRSASVLGVVPWLESGFAAVNVQYRLAKDAPAPAAVEDAVCAVRWVFANSVRHGFDTRRVVVTGQSAGGHLALAAAMLPASSDLARSCPARPPEHVTWSAAPPAWEPRVAAVVNWFGITDVAEMLEGPTARSYAIEWLGAQPDRAAIAARVSPLALVRPGVPPVLTIHGDADKAVPHAHATRLHAALDRAGVPNRLVTIPGGGHGGFDRAQLATIADETRAFLERVLSAR